MIDRSSSSSGSAGQGYRAWATRLDLIGLASRAVLSGVLLWAGLSKITNLDQSVLAVRAYQLLPWDWTTVIGYALPIIEIAVGVLLILGLFTRVSAVIASALMLAFVIGISSAWARGLSIDCGCFGGGGEISPQETNYLTELLRDAGLLALGVWLTIRPRSKWRLDRWLLAPASSGPADRDRSATEPEVSNGSTADGYDGANTSVTAADRPVTSRSPSEGAR